MLSLIYPEKSDIIDSPKLSLLFARSLLLYYRLK